MKNLVIFLINTVHYSNHFMIHQSKGASLGSSGTFSLFMGGSGAKDSSTDKGKESGGVLPASRIILQTILVKQY